MVDNQPPGQDEDPSVTPAENENTGNDSGATETTPEENEPGGNQGESARYQELVRRRKKAEADAQHWKNIANRLAQVDEQTTRGHDAPAQPSQPQYNETEVEQAYRTLTQRGVATREDLERLQLRMSWDRTHDQNEQRFNSGSSRYPKYDRQEVEEYARNHNIGDPTAAYRDMYFDEILDAARAESHGQPTTKVVTEKPTKSSTSSSNEPLTLDSFKEKLRGPNGLEFYQKLAANPKKFDALLKDLASEE